MITPRNLNYIEYYALSGGHSKWLIEEKIISAPLTPKHLAAHDLFESGKIQEAQVTFKKILRIKPKDSHALLGLGKIEMLRENAKNAKAFFMKAIKVDPQNSLAWTGLGKLCLEQGDGDGAAEALTKAIQLDHQNADAHFNLGLTFRGVRPDWALDLFLKAININPADPIAYLEAGSLFREMGHLDQAYQILLEGLKIKPDYGAAHNQMGRTLYDMGHVPQAVEAFKRAIASDPSTSEYYNNLTVILIEADKIEEARDLIHEALRRNPTLASAHNNKGLIHAKDGEHEAAINSYQKAIACQPDYPEAYTNLANVYQVLNQPQLAVETLEKVMSMAPEFDKARYNISYAHFMAGTPQKGWQHYRERFTSGETMPNRRFHEAKRWTGSPLDDKTILVWREQGIGDEFIFVKCLHELHAANPDAKIIYETEARLIGLMQRAFPFAQVREQQSDNKGTPFNELDDYDFELPVGDLNLFYRTRLEDFPSTAVHLFPDPTLKAEFTKRLKSLGDGFKVGICWRSGLATRERDMLYHVDLMKYWDDIFQTPNCHFLNLQYGEYEAELQAAERAKEVTFHRWADVDYKEDMDKVAAIMANCDVIISPVTSVAQLGGAMGLPTLVPHYEGYWLLFGTGRSPNFPTQRFFMSPAGSINQKEGMKLLTQGFKTIIETGDPLSFVLNQ